MDALDDLERGIWQAMEEIPDALVVTPIREAWGKRGCTILTVLALLIIFLPALVLELKGEDGAG